jgi:hypothetical protein
VDRPLQIRAGGGVAGEQVFQVKQVEIVMLQETRPTGERKRQPAVFRLRAAALLFQRHPEPARQWWIFRDRRSNFPAARW